jgi:hypothetical protein
MAGACAGAEGALPVALATSAAVYVAGVILGAVTCWKKAFCAWSALANPVAAGAGFAAAGGCGFSIWAREGRIGVVMPEPYTESGI